VGVSICISWLYRTDHGNSELAREKMWMRIHLIPVLQAEEDRDVVRKDFARKAMERELLGREVPVYNKERYDIRWRRKRRRHARRAMLTHGNRFVRPTYAVTPANVVK
jgi:hypothetical protein